MYCQNCGTPVADGTRFCPNCGQNCAGGNIPVQQNYGAPAQPYYGNAVEQRAAVRRDETAELQKMIRYFSQKSAQYEEYDYVCARIDPRYLRKRTGLLVWGIIISVLGLIVTIAVGSSGAAGAIFSGILILFGGIGMIVGFALSSSARNRNYQAALIRFDELTEELYQHYLNYGYCLVSAEYTNPSNLVAILQTIESGRADTIKEAVNILVEDAHRNNMESYARQTAISSAAAARGANAAAVFSAANFFLK